MRNPIRRSKRIGRTQGGRVKGGKAEEKFSKVFTQTTWRKLSEEHEGLWVIRENPSRGFFHPCGPRLVREAISRLPRRLTEDVRAVVLRRLPKKDERLFIDARLRHRCVILNAFPKNLRMWWPGKPTASAIKRMKPWCENWRQEGGRWFLQWDAPRIRRFYLYHLLLHEIGHVHQFSTSSRRKRESFAENFALEWARKLGQLQ